MALQRTHRLGLPTTPVILALIKKQESDFLPQATCAFIGSDLKTCLVVAPMGGENRQHYGKQIHTLRWDALYVRDAFQIGKPRMMVFEFKIPKEHLANVKCVLRKDFKATSPSYKTALAASLQHNDAGPFIIKWQSVRGAIPLERYTKFAGNPAALVPHIEKDLQKFDSDIQTMGAELDTLEVSMQRIQAQLAVLAKYM